MNSLYLVILEHNIGTISSPMAYLRKTNVLFWNRPLSHAIRTIDCVKENPWQNPLLKFQMLSNRNLSTPTCKCQGWKIHTRSNILTYCIVASHASWEINSLWLEFYYGNTVISLNNFHDNGVFVWLYIVLVYSKSGGVIVSNMLMMFFPAGILSLK